MALLKYDARDLVHADEYKPTITSVRLQPRVFVKRNDGTLESHRNWSDDDHAKLVAACSRPDSEPLVCFSATIIYCRGRSYTKNVVTFVATSTQAWDLERVYDDAQPDPLLLPTRVPTLVREQAIDPVVFFRSPKIWLRTYRLGLRRFFRERRDFYS